MPAMVGGSMILEVGAVDLLGVGVEDSIVVDVGVDDNVVEVGVVVAVMSVLSTGPSVAGARISKGSVDISLIRSLARP